MQIDPVRVIGAVTREVGSRDHEGQPARVVIVRRIYDTTAEDLWDTLTNGERIPRWFLPVSGDLRLGGHYELKGNASGTITRCEAPRVLALTWEFGGSTSWVTVRLRPAGAAGTELELEHVSHVDASWEQFGPGAVGVGWDLALVALGEHLATGANVAGAAGEQWMAGDEGQTFMRLSSEAWGRASIDAGTPEADARAAMARTTAAYTGSA